jgi:hypothetical protein
MSLAAIVAGAPFFFADGEGDEAELGGSLAPSVADGLEEGVEDSVGVGVGEGERLCFFFGEESGVGVGEDFRFFFGEAEAPGSGFCAGVGFSEAFLFFGEEGDGDFSGVADGVGDFFASSFFFGAGELLRCFRGVGVGVGAKIFLILLPNDSSACTRSATPKSIASKKRVPAILLTHRMERESSTWPGDE